MTKVCRIPICGITLFTLCIVKSNIFEQEQLEEEQKVEDGDISCKVLPGEGNEVCFKISICAFGDQTITIRLATYVEKLLSNFGRKIWKNGILKMQ